METDKVRRGPQVKMFGDEKCQICKRKADGYHYNVLSCQGCKGFFRRTVLSKLEYVCKNGLDKCDLAVVDHPRQRCQKCRLRRCEEAGMRDQYVRRKKNRTRTQRILENMRRPTVIVNPLVKEQHKLMAEVLNCFDKITDIESQKQVLAPLYLAIQKSSSAAQQEKLKMESFFQLIVNLIVSFAKNLSPFKVFSFDDQVKILSSSLIEIFVLQSITKYDPLTKCVTTFDGSVINQARLSGLSTQEFGKSVFETFARIKKTASSTHLLALLTALTLFSPDRNYSKELDAKVDNVQQHYIDLLRQFIARNHPLEKKLLPRLLMLLTYLRQFSDHSMIQHKATMKPFEHIAPMMIGHILKTPNVPFPLSTTVIGRDMPESSYN
ncbi:Oidioi.mRNA.OKI2018_I69.XSR.g16141.t1.cds [Oikopleura dioica]|uniref:Oidioi.mRNA.OKI2018_I69.XSR.g16141.t1.cds n=1 Tax=Oikopleura dioica TaxID=34765 RepID=A0ABN7SK93_OIKDI|nr:Oidioi.mRNA.OKI2018_I69.XSR.g16141.t1.cds [Oikopleura dioica]